MNLELNQAKLIKFALDDLNSVYLGRTYIAQLNNKKKQDYTDFFKISQELQVNPVYLLDVTLSYHSYLERKRKNKRPVSIYFVVDHAKHAHEINQNYRDKRFSNHNLLITTNLTNLTARAIYLYFEFLAKDNYSNHDFFKDLRKQEITLKQDLKQPYRGKLGYLNTLRARLAKKGLNLNSIVLLKGIKSLNPLFILFNHLLKDYPKDLPDDAINYVGLEHLTEYNYNQSDLTNLINFYQYLDKEDTKWKTMN